LCPTAKSLQADIRMVGYTGRYQNRELRTGLLYEYQTERLTPEFVQDFNEYTEQRGFGVAFLSTETPADAHHSGRQEHSSTGQRQHIRPGISPGAARPGHPSWCSVAYVAITSCCRTKPAKSRTGRRPALASAIWAKRPCDSASAERSPGTKWCRSWR
jgi:hypothetical protein